MADGYQKRANLLEQSRELYELADDMQMGGWEARTCDVLRWEAMRLSDEAWQAELAMMEGIDR